MKTIRMSEGIETNTLKIQRIAIGIRSRINSLYQALHDDPNSVARGRSQAFLQAD
jgi:hypothetical protein